jgi:hypothetical protein
LGHLLSPAPNMRRHCTTLFRNSMHWRHRQRGSPSPLQSPDKLEVVHTSIPVRFVPGAPGTAGRAVYEIDTRVFTYTGNRRLQAQPAPTTLAEQIEDKLGIQRWRDVVVRCPCLELDLGGSPPCPGRTLWAHKSRHAAAGQASHTPSSCRSGNALPRFSGCAVHRARTDTIV